MLTLPPCPLPVHVPALKGEKLEETNCTVISHDLGIDSPRDCVCGRHCASATPCSKVYVDYPELPHDEPHPILHTSLTTLTRYQGCSFDNRNCAGKSMESNTIIAKLWLAQKYPVNMSFACFYDPKEPEDVVLERDIKTGDIAHALVWPLILLVIGGLLCVGSSEATQNICGMCCVAVMLPCIGLAACYSKIKKKFEESRTEFGLAPGRARTGHRRDRSASRVSVTPPHGEPQEETPPQYATGESAPMYEPSSQPRAISIEFDNSMHENEPSGFNDSSMPPTFAEAAINPEPSTLRSITPEPQCEPLSYQAATVLTDGTNEELESLGIALETTTF